MRRSARARTVPSVSDSTISRVIPSARLSARCCSCPPAALRRIWWRDDKFPALPFTQSAARTSREEIELSGCIRVLCALAGTGIPPTPRATATSSSVRCVACRRRVLNLRSSLIFAPCCEIEQTYEGAHQTPPLKWKGRRPAPESRHSSVTTVHRAPSVLTS
jgi:hypothetical protein